MRKYRIDEFPQLVNVIRGEMNIVGPRPERPSIFSRLSGVGQPRGSNFDMISAAYSSGLGNHVRFSGLSLSFKNSDLM